MMIAQKYAAAFMNLYGASLRMQDSKQLFAAAQFLKDHRRALFLLQVPTLDRTIKREGLAHLLQRFELPNSMMRLIDQLIDDGRAHLIADVFAAIGQQYTKKHQLSLVKVVTAAPLAAADRQELETIMNEKIPGSKEYQYLVDQSLIAGIRIQTDTLLWEYSIDKQLRDLSHAGSW